MLQLGTHSLRVAHGRRTAASAQPPAAALGLQQGTCPRILTPLQFAPSTSSSAHPAAAHGVAARRWGHAPTTRPTRAVLARAHVTPPEYTLTDRPPARLAVFVSGGGSNFKSIHAAILDGRINATVVAVVSDVPACGGVQYAQQHGIATMTFPVVKKGENQGQGLSPAQLVDGLKNTYKADYVLLAGFLKLIPPELCRAYPRAMLNIHPGLLPSFGGKGYYGERVHKAVVASGARFSGPTVHFVDEEFDTGPILAQRVVPVYPNDSPKQLAARVLKEEHQVYPDCVSALCDGRITWREDGIPILWKAH